MAVFLLGATFFVGVWTLDSGGVRKLEHILIYYQFIFLHFTFVFLVLFQWGVRFIIHQFCIIIDFSRTTYKIICTYLCEVVDYVCCNDRLETTSLLKSCTMVLNNEMLILYILCNYYYYHIQCILLIENYD